MRARLQPFGTDFGNGAVDRRCFQRDDLEAKTLAAKQTTRGRYRAVTGPCREAAVHEAVLGWLEAVLAEERPDLGLPLDSLDDRPRLFIPNLSDVFANARISLECSRS